MSAVLINKKAWLAGNRAKSWEERYNRTLQPLSRNKPSSVFHRQCPLLAQSGHRCLHISWLIPHLIRRSKKLALKGRSISGKDRWDNCASRSAMPRQREMST